jgi:hypothetical protein
MKHLSVLYTALLVISTMAATAQETKPSVPATQRISVGGYLGVTNTMVNPVLVGLENDITCASAGIFGRLFTGEHFALQAELSYRASERDFGTVAFNSFSGRVTQSRDVRYHAFATLLQGQYFLLSNKHQLRPYFAGGAGWISYHYRMKVSEDLTGNRFRLTQNERSIVIQFAQGLVYDINAKWQFNQSFYYQYEHDGQNTIGLNLGAAYKLR